MPQLNPVSAERFGTIERIVRALEDVIEACIACAVGSHARG
jgi:hypothetical protein